ncbi:universal stress protein [Streptomyces gibsoniae]|uniref:Universal stress protein n=1 Tax=Streptomyces gibsoniae TaxID=3075529 RepID=A0ABU2U6E9_9ACTN|nr:universal stress protein [Streptomyces sp. DSM 41699]MDT0468797.1 universal stress protein [Streptomyces sp. DSM 41699]
MSEGPVVVGTDGSAGAARAVLWAAQEAALRHQPLHIVCAVDVDLAQRLSDETASRVREAARSLAAEAAAAASDRAPGLVVTTEVGREPAADSLLREAAAVVPRAEGARATIVVGSRGAGGFSALLLGSVGLTVAGQASCPVVVVRGTERPSSRVVVVGVRDEEDLGAVRFAGQTARRRKASLRLLSAWSYFQYFGSMVPLADAVRRTVEAEAAASTRMLGSVREEFPDLKVTEEVARAPSPAGELVEASSHADLVVLGAHRPAHHVGRALGRVAHAVLQHAQCPVAVVPRG